MRQLTNAVVFGAFALAVVALPGPRRGFEILLLLALAIWGHRHASQGMSRIPGILAFGLGWFGYPLVALAGLWIVTFIERSARDAPPGDVAARAELARLTLRTALDSPGRIRAFRAPFQAAAGTGEVPLLMVNASGEAGFYLEPGAWDAAARKRFFDWIVKLRASNRAGLHVEVRGAKPAPDEVLRACRLESR